MIEKKFQAKIYTSEETTEELKKIREEIDKEHKESIQTISPELQEFKPLTINQIKEILGEETVNLLRKISLFGEVPVIPIYPFPEEKNKKIFLILGAHPDEYLESGGYFAQKKLQEKDNLEIISILSTPGNKSKLAKILITSQLILMGKFKKLKRLEEIVALRRAKESFKSSQILRERGNYVLNFSDQGLKEKESILEESMEKIISSIKPDVVFVTDPKYGIAMSTGKVHPDHEVMGNVVTRICDRQGIPLIYYLCDTDKLPKGQQIIYHINLKEARKLERKAIRAHWSQLNIISSFRYGAGKKIKIFRSREKEIKKD